MKFRLTSALLFATLLSVFNLAIAYSASFGLTKIGSLDTADKNYSEWWYTGTNPTMAGTAEAGDIIKIVVNVTDTYTGTADSQGNWSIALPLVAGDYGISILRNSDEYAFVLHLGQAFPGDTTAATTAQTTSSTGSAVPDTGLNQTSAILLGTGISLLALYFYFFESNKKRVAFEREIVGD